MVIFVGCDMIFPQEDGDEMVVILDEVPFVTSLDDADARLDEISFAQALDDLDGDGALDLLVEGAFVYTYSNAFAEGATEIPRQGRIASGDGVGWISSALGDLDGDGADALAVSAFEPIAGADDDTSYAGVVDGIPEGSQPIWEGAQATYEGVNPGDEVGKHLSAGDVDGDGEVDLVITNSRNDGGLLYGPAVPRPVYIVHGPHEGTSSLADADDTIWENETTDYIDLGGVIAGRFTSSAADDLLVHAGGRGAAFHFER